jgi:hypothetical protein
MKDVKQQWLPENLKPSDPEYIYYQRRFEFIEASSIALVSRLRVCFCGLI